jgi:hypothetical protein
MLIASPRPSPLRTGVANMADTKSTKFIEARRRGATARNSGITPDQRFWSKVQKSDDCWEWQGPRNWKGYGEHSVNCKAFKAHRYSWMLHYGEIPKGMQVCHRCDNRGCVRPDHLFVGTNSDNQRDAVTKGRGPSAKLSSEDVRLIRGLLDLRVSATEIAFRFGVSRSAIMRVKHGQAYTYVG